jgi:hypothetical protein
MATPSEISKVFLGTSTTLRRNYEDLVTVSSSRLNAKSLHKYLSEQLVISLAVRWEAYLNDLLISYVVFAPRVAKLSLEQDAKKLVLGKLGKGLEKLVLLSYPASLSAERVSQLLDPKGYNISATSPSELSKFANKFLLPRFARKFFLDKRDTEFLELFFGLRNFLSHRSAGSLVILKDSLSKITETDNLIFLPLLKDIGSYLAKVPMSATGPTLTRASVIALRIEDLGKRLG